MKRTALLLTLAWLVSCGPADDVGNARPGSTGEEPASTRSDSGQATPGGAAASRGPAAATDADPRPRAVFLGTSLTAGFGLLRDSERFTDLLQAMVDSAGIPVTIVNAGLSGDTSAGGLSRLEWVLQQPADVLVVELGANDGLRGQSVPAMKQNLERIIVRARELSPGVRVVLAGMEAPPNLGDRYTTDFRDAFQNLAREHAVTLVPFLLEGVAGVTELNQEDRIHPTAEGHQRIARTLWPYLEPLLREAAGAGTPQP
jgi:acyl-CoA thioesterase-1